jgi:hypothetical protein
LIEPCVSVGSSENPEIYGLVDEIVGVGLLVIVRDADKNYQSLVNFAGRLPVDSDFSARRPLDYETHALSPELVRRIG